MSTLITWMAAMVITTDGGMVIEANATSDDVQLARGLAHVSRLELEHCDASVALQVVDIDTEYDPVEGIVISDIPDGAWCTINFVFTAEPTFTTVDDEEFMMDQAWVMTVDTGLNPFGVSISKGVMTGNPG